MQILQIGKISLMLVGIAAPLIMRYKITHDLGTPYVYKILDIWKWWILRFFQFS